MGKPLTPREYEILRLLADGLTRAGIARELDTHLRSIDRATRSLLAKLGAATTAHAVAIACGGLPPDAGSWTDMVCRWRADGYRVALVRIPKPAPLDDDLGATHVKDP